MRIERAPIIFLSLILGVMIGAVIGHRFSTGDRAAARHEVSFPSSPTPSPFPEIQRDCPPAVLAKAIENSVKGNIFFDPKLNHGADPRVRSYVDLPEQRDGARVYAVIFEQDGHQVYGHVLFHLRSCTAGDMIYGAALNQAQ